MHNAGFIKLGMDACYVPFAVDPGSLADAVRAIVPLGLQGLNVTVPHKEKVIPFLHELSEEARLINAVNTIEVVEGKLIGHNTDGRGFLRSLTDDAGFDPRGKRFLSWAQGVRRGRSASALRLPVRQGSGSGMWTGEKAEALVGDIRNKTGVSATAVRDEAIETSARAADCLVNATPLGLRKSDPLPIGKEQIQRGQLVCDLVYNPPETALLKAARARGAQGLSGLGMLLYQGVIAFEIWTGKKAPVRVMKNALAGQIASRRA